jgi:hypothetical protein
MDMKNWIPFAEGEYLADQALLVAENQNAVLVEDVIIEVYSDQRLLKLYPLSHPRNTIQN